MTQTQARITPSPAVWPVLTTRLPTPQFESEEENHAARTEIEPGTFAWETGALPLITDFISSILILPQNNVLYVCLCFQYTLLGRYFVLCLERRRSGRLCNELLLFVLFLSFTCLAHDDFNFSMAGDFRFINTIYVTYTFRQSSP